MHISWLDMGTREYDLEYMKRLEEQLEHGYINDRHSKNPQYSDCQTRRLTRHEKSELNIEIARIKRKWHL
jgi:hypothetical protein